MFNNLTGWHLLIVLAVILLIFGATRLPALARSIGQSTKILKDELKSDEKKAPVAESTEAPSDASTTTAASTSAPSTKPADPV